MMRASRRRFIPRPILESLESRDCPAAGTSLVPVGPRAVPPPAASPSPASLDSPESVVSVDLETTRVGKGRKARAVTEIAVSFSGALDPGSAQDQANYILAQPGQDRKFGTRDDRRIKIASARYDPDSDTVTLTPRGGRLAITPAVQLRIIGSRILDAGGVPIDGDDDGEPGGNAVAVIKKDNTAINGDDGGGDGDAFSASLGALAANEFLASTQADSILPGRRSRRGRS